MVVEIRMYKRFDTDLVALCDAGYSVSTMIRDAIIGYANASPVHFYIDEPVDFDLNGKKNVHTRLDIPNSEQKACYILRNIKHGYRNTFCKMILRNALIQQNLIGFFADQSLAQLQSSNLAGINIYSFPNLIPCSNYKRKGGKQEELSPVAAIQTPRSNTTQAFPGVRTDAWQMPNPYMPAFGQQMPFQQPQPMQKYTPEISYPATGNVNPVPAATPAAAAPPPVMPAQIPTPAPVQENTPMPVIPTTVSVQKHEDTETQEQGFENDETSVIQGATNLDLLAAFDAI